MRLICSLIFCLLFGSVSSFLKFPHGSRVSFIRERKKTLKHNLLQLETSSSSNFEGSLSDILRYPNHSQHLIQGAWRMCCSTTLGLFFGSSCLVTCPILAVTQSGISGLFHGLIQGASLSVAFSVMGTAYGSLELLYGAGNTAQSVRAHYKSLVWDEEKQRYLPYSLLQEAENILSGKKRPVRKPLFVETIPKVVKENEYYDLIGVASDASPDQIKRAYYKVARTCHPDKNPNDPEAAAKFQKIGTAYQVLSNPTLRDKYDKEGKEELKNAHTLTPPAFFAMVFGSEDFEPLVGALKLATMAGADHEVSSEESAFQQRKREVQIAVNLREMMAPFVVEGQSEDDFAVRMQAKASSLAVSPFGEELLHVIGAIYLRACEEHRFRFKPMTGFKRTSSMRFHQAKTWTLMGRSMWFRYQSKRSSHSEQRKQALAQRSKHLLVRAIWSMIQYDTKQTIRNALHKLLHDKSVDNEVITKRAIALEMMGKIFLKAKCIPFMDEFGVFHLKSWEEDMDEKLGDTFGVAGDEEGE